MSSRIKHEVSNARTRLDATLQHLVDKKDDSFNLQDSSQESDDGSDILPVTVEVVRSSGTPISTPTKKSYVPRVKKRKRKDYSLHEDEEANYHRKSETTYVMRLFDRSVDLAQFTESTPLYPIARKWINSKGESELETPDEKPEEEINMDNVYELPHPVKLKTEYGVELKDPRIPALIPSNEKRLDIHADPDRGPPPEELLLRHMARWKDIRNSWVNASRVNELKYSASLNIIKDIFEKNLQEQSFDG